jgi:RNA polymerase sigma-70 factor (ECF subfamily)
MTHQTERPDGSDDRQHWFTTTHWSVVLSARAPSPQASNALEALCRTYWPPLYTYIRRRGFDVHAAQDLTQQFITHLLAKDFLEGLSPERGRFRSFLLAALKNFLINEHKRAVTQKRGGGVTFVSMNADDEEQWLSAEPVTNETAEDVFDRRWALTILERAFEALRQEFATTAKAAQFERLKEFLEGEVDRGDYNGAAQDLQMSPGAVSVAVHRLRQRYRELLRREVADTLGAPEQVEEELRDVMRALSR